MNGGSDQDGCGSAAAAPSVAAAALWSLGDVAYCHLAVRGVVRATQVLVVASDCCQAVVAAPAACAVSHTGDWAKSGELAVQQIYRGACAQSGTECALVLHSLDPRLLLAAAPPGALMFVAPDGTLAELASSTVAALFHGAAQGQAVRIQSVRCPSDAVPCYHAAILATGAELFHQNSVLLMPDLLTKEECRILIEAADSHFEDLCNDACDDAIAGQRPAWLTLADSPSLQRLCVSKLGPEIEALSAAIITERLVPFFEAHLPAVSAAVFGRRAGLAAVPIFFSPGEPAVNRYSEGGSFKTHSDKLDVTLNVLLSEPDAFAGGGTAFWSEDRAALGRPESLLLKPRQGTGVVFNGSVEHAGREVERGLRHLYVASFGVVDKQVKDARAA